MFLLSKFILQLNKYVFNQSVYVFKVAQLSSYIVEADKLSSLSLRNSGITDHSFGRLALAIQISDAKPKVIICVDLHVNLTYEKIIYIQ